MENIENRALIEDEALEDMVGIDVSDKNIEELRQKVHDIENKVSGIKVSSTDNTAAKRFAKAIIGAAEKIEIDKIVGRLNVLERLTDILAEKSDIDHELTDLKVKKCEMDIEERLSVVDWLVIADTVHIFIMAAVGVIKIISWVIKRISRARKGGRK